MNTTLKKKQHKGGTYEVYESRNGIPREMLELDLQGRINGGKEGKTVRKCAEMVEHRHRSGKAGHLTANMYPRKASNL